MKNTFLKGDAVRYVRNSAKVYEHLVQKVFVLEEDSYFLMEDGKPVEFVRIKVYNHTQGFFVARFDRVEEDIKAGSFVIAVRDVGVSVTENARYYVERFNDAGTLVKVRGVGNYIRKDAFRPSHNDINVDKALEIVDEGERLLKALDKKVGKSPGVCSYAVQTDDGDVRWHVKDVCHARLRLWENEISLKNAALHVRGHYEAANNPKHYKEWVTYITQESPWKDCFLPRSVDKILNDGVLLNLDKTINEVICAAVALRIGSEFPTQLKLFNEIIELGFSKNLAFVVSSFFKKTNKGYTFFQNTAAHHVLHYRQVVNDLSKFFKEGYFLPNDRKPYRVQNNTSYQLYPQIARSINDNGNYLKGSINDFILTIEGFKKEEEGWGGVSFSFPKENALFLICSAFGKHF